MTRRTVTIEAPSAETWAMLDKVAAANLPPIETQQPAEARLQFGARAKASCFPSVEVGPVQDIAIPLQGRALPGRCYRPGTGEAPWPLIVYFHGGGMVIGDLDTHDPICRRICAETRAMVISVGYRKAPEFPFPHAANDAVEAFRYLSRSGGDPDIDRGRIFVAGDSAGGTLAAVVAQDCAVARPGLLAAQILIYPALDHVSVTPSREALAEQFPINSAAIAWFEGQYFGAAGQRRSLLASPGLKADLAGVAPALVITAGLDPLRDEGEAYARRLADVAQPTRHVHYTGTVHGFLGMGAVISAACDAVHDIARYVAAFG